MSGDGFIGGLQRAFSEFIEASGASDRRAARREAQRAAGWELIVEGEAEPVRVEAPDAAAAWQLGRRKFGKRCLSVQSAVVYQTAAEVAALDRNNSEPGWQERAERELDEHRGISFGGLS